MAHDPIHTDPDKYHTILENERVRVLDYTDKPGDKTTQHHHPDFVLYTLAPFKRRLYSADGSFREREFQAGEIVWNHAQEHIGENIGTTDTHVLIIEFKEPRPQ